jgi:putative transposase
MTQARKLKVDIAQNRNAAMNLKNMAVSSTVSACGEEGADLGRKIKVKPASAKQEVNAKATYA